ncbi:MAG TPA: hypothetical protein VJK30_01185 [Coxiellaceae bacterium]|nr:hypothetical protein [Coxiellaceae bacterium]
MKLHSVMTCIGCFIIGILIGAGITYFHTRCETNGMHIKFDSSGQNGSGITITKTGNSQ